MIATFETEGINVAMIRYPSIAATGGPGAMPGAAGLATISASIAPTPPSVGAAAATVAAPASSPPTTVRLLQP